MIVASMLKHNRGIGHQGDLCVRDKSDLQLFKELTWGSNIVMGRKTAESLPAPLICRDNFVLTRDASWWRDGFIPCYSLDALPPNPVFIGGEILFKQVLDHVSEIHISLFDRPDLQADVFMPPFEEAFYVHEVIPYAKFNHVVWRRR